MAKKQPVDTVSEHEGMLLALVLRRQPVTTYQIYKFFEQSPVSSINSSKGQIYPAIRRLKERALLKAEPIRGSKQEELSVTAIGKDAVRKWTNSIGPAQIALDDPLRTRVLSFDVLSREEQIEWVARAKSLVKGRREALDEYNKSVDVPYQQFAYQSVSETLRVKMEWLDELLYFLVRPD
jgi:DNA-binding PadR family transcriptional regulator